MNITFIFIIVMLALSIAAPFISLYAVSLIKKANHQAHIKVQKRLFWTCIAAVVALEVQIRVAGGSGSLVANSEYTDTPFFKAILIAHIIGAVLTYILWAFTIFASNRGWKKRKTLPGPFSMTHKRLGYFTIAGLSYTAVTAFLVCTFAFFL